MRTSGLSLFRPHDFFLEIAIVAEDMNVNYSIIFNCIYKCILAIYQYDNGTCMLGVLYIYFTDFEIQTVLYHLLLLFIYVQFIITTHLCNELIKPWEGAGYLLNLIRYCSRVDSALPKMLYFFQERGNLINFSLAFIGQVPDLHVQLQGEIYD